jgi:hypothetical protein
VRFFEGNFFPGSFSGGGFSEFFLHPWYQNGAVTEFLRIFDGNRQNFKCARCRDLTYAYIIICAVLRVVVTQTSPPKRPISDSSSWARKSAMKARTAQFQYVFP